LFDVVDSILFSEGGGMTTMPKVIRVDSLFTFRNLIYLVTLGGQELSSFVHRPFVESRCIPQNSEQSVSTLYMTIE